MLARLCRNGNNSNRNHKNDSNSIKNTNNLTCVVDVNLASSMLNGIEHVAFTTHHRAIR